jgi:hypothetical protein
MHPIPKYLEKGIVTRVPMHPIPKYLEKGIVTRVTMHPTPEYLEKGIVTRVQPPMQGEEHQVIVSRVSEPTHST